MESRIVNTAPSEKERKPAGRELQTAAPAVIHGKQDCETILRHYPESTDIVQEYGASGADNNGAGKVVSRTDESGTITYEYGKLGEMTEESRSIVREGGYDAMTAVTGYESDYLGRMEHITYPDGEIVTYTYDTGGNVQTVTGTKEGYDDFYYVKDIGYDEYGQRVYISYGNGTETTYTYDPARRWLKSLVTESEEDGVIQNMQYTFDTVGNVEGYTNSCGGWDTSQDYTYDSLYQLIKVSGETENKYATADRPSYNATYSQTFAFSSDGLCNMTGKVSKESEVLEDDLNYTLDYTYDSDYAHRAVQAGSRYYRYDANGNLIREQDKSFADTDSSDEVTYHLIQTEAENVYSTDYAWARMKGGSTAYASTKSNYYYRDYTWNERNLLSQTKDDSYTTEYLYGGDGQRAVKRSSVSETLYFNKFFTQRYDDAYQGAGGRMSKHIFLGNDRIVTKQVALGTGEDYDNADTGVERKYMYYYHADHLGSTSVVTDRDGEVYERLEYTPYGETWLDETNGDTYFDTPYRFSAKEKDEETGLYYYGARYLDPKYSRWISADPALGAYVFGTKAGGGIYNSHNFNLYNYANNNPIKYTDPNGMFSWDEDGQGGTVTDKDTLSQITKDYNSTHGTDLDYHDVAKNNGIENPDKINPGQRVQLGKPDNYFDNSSVSFNSVRGGDGQILGYGADGEERKEKLGNAPSLTESISMDINIGIFQGSAGFEATTSVNGKKANPFVTGSSGVSTPGLGFTAAVAMNFSQNYGNNNVHSMNISLFGFGGSVAFSENGITQIGLSVSTTLKGAFDFGSGGISYELFSK